MATLVLDPALVAASQSKGPVVGAFRRPLPPAFKQRSAGAVSDGQDDAERAQYQKGRVAMAARIMHDEGWGIGCAVGVTARDARDPALVWVLPRGKPLSTIVSADLIGVDLGGNVVVPNPEGRGYDDAYVPLHLDLYAARQDVNGVATGHPPYAKVFSARGQVQKTLWQDSSIFHNRTAVLPFAAAFNAGSAEGRSQISGVVRRGEGAGPAAEGPRALILANRGIATLSQTIEGAVGLFIRLERLIGGQLLAEAAARGRGGEVIPIGEDEAMLTYKNAGSEHHAWMMSMPVYAKQDRLTGGALVI